MAETEVQTVRSTAAGTDSSAAGDGTPSPDIVYTAVKTTTDLIATTSATSATTVTATASPIAASSAQPETKRLKIHFVPGAVPLVPDLYYIPRNVYVGRYAIKYLYEEIPSSPLMSA